MSRPFLAFLLLPLPLWAAAAVVVLTPVRTFATQLFRPPSVALRSCATLCFAIALSFVLLSSRSFAADTTVPIGAWYTDLLPFLEGVAAIAVTAIVGLIGWSVRRLIGVTIDAKLTTMLHDTLLRAAQRGLEAVGKEIGSTTVDVHSQVIASAINYARSYRPDLLKHFGLTDAQLADLIRVHLAKLLPDGILTASASAA